VSSLTYCELCGGPYDGFVLLPQHSGFISKYMSGRDDPEAFMQSWSAKNHPTEVEFLEMDLFRVDGPMGEAWYRQADDVRWRMIDMEAMMS
jgi:hypothetical protein